MSTTRRNKFVPTRGPKFNPLAASGHSPGLGVVVPDDQWKRNYVPFPPFFAKLSAAAASGKSYVSVLVMQARAFFSRMQEDEVEKALCKMSKKRARKNKKLLVQIIGLSNYQKYFETTNKSDALIQAEVLHDSSSLLEDQQNSLSPQAEKPMDLLVEQEEFVPVALASDVSQSSQSPDNAEEEIEEIFTPFGGDEYSDEDFDSLYGPSLYATATGSDPPRSDPPLLPDGLISYPVVGRDGWYTSPTVDYIFEVDHDTSMSVMEYRSPFKVIIETKPRSIFVHDVPIDHIKFAGNYRITSHQQFVHITDPTNKKGCWDSMRDKLMLKFMAGMFSASKRWIALKVSAAMVYYSGQRADTRLRLKRATMNTFEEFSLKNIAETLKAFAQTIPFHLDFVVEFVCFLIYVIKGDSIIRAAAGIHFVTRIASLLPWDAAIDHLKVILKAHEPQPQSDDEGSNIFRSVTRLFWFGLTGTDMADREFGKMTKQVNTMFQLGRLTNINLYTMSRLVEKSLDYVYRVAKHRRDVEKFQEILQPANEWIDTANSMVETKGKYNNVYQARIANEHGRRGAELARVLASERTLSGHALNFRSVLAKFDREVLTVSRRALQSQGATLAPLSVLIIGDPSTGKQLLALMTANVVVRQYRGSPLTEQDIARIDMRSEFQDNIGQALVLFFEEFLSSKDPDDRRRDLLNALFYGGAEVKLATVATPELKNITFIKAILNVFLSNVKSLPSELVSSMDAVRRRMGIVLESIRRPGSAHGLSFKEYEVAVHDSFAPSWNENTRVAVLNGIEYFEYLKDVFMYLQQTDGDLYNKFMESIAEFGVEETMGGTKFSESSKFEWSQPRHREIFMRANANRATKYAKEIVTWAHEVKVRLSTRLQSIYVIKTHFKAPYGTLEEACPRVRGLVVYNSPEACRYIRSHDVVVVEDAMAFQQAFPAYDGVVYSVGLAKMICDIHVRSASEIWDADQLQAYWPTPQGFNVSLDMNKYARNVGIFAGVMVIAYAIKSLVKTYLWTDADKSRSDNRSQHEIAMVEAGYTEKTTHTTEISVGSYNPTISMPEMYSTGKPAVAPLTPLRTYPQGELEDGATKKIKNNNVLVEFRIDGEVIRSFRIFFGTPIRAFGTRHEYDTIASQLHNGDFVFVREGKPDFVRKATLITVTTFLADFVIYSFDEPIVGIKDMTGMFVEPDKYPLLIRKDEKNLILWNCATEKVVSNPSFHSPHNLHGYGTFQYVYYQSPTVPGDCGSVIYSVKTHKVYAIHLSGSVSEDYGFPLHTGVLTQPQGDIPAYIPPEYWTNWNCRPIRPVSRMESRTKYRKTLLWNESCEVAPAALRVTEDGRSPLYNGLLKRTPYPDLAPSIKKEYKRAVDVLVHKLGHSPIAPPYSLDEAIQLIDLKGSMGYRWRSRGLVLRSEVIDPQTRERIADTPLKQEFWNRVDTRWKMQPTDPPFHEDQLKDELRPLRKVKNAKTRIYSICDFDDILVQFAHWYPLQEFIKNTYSETGIMIGMSPTDERAVSIYHALRDNPYALEMDGDAYDLHIRTFHIRMARRFFTRSARKWWHKESVARFKYLTAHYLNPVVVTLGVVANLKQGLLSGWMGTSQIGSVIHKLTNDVIERKNPTGMFLALYSDDNTRLSKVPVEPFVDYFLKGYAECGFPFRVESIRYNNIRFLKRSFIVVQGTPRLVKSPEEIRINEGWTSIEGSDMEVLKQKMQDQEAEFRLYGHGPIYREFLKRVEKMPFSITLDPEGAPEERSVVNPREYLKQLLRCDVKILNNVLDVYWKYSKILLSKLPPVDRVLIRLPLVKVHMVPQNLAWVLEELDKPNPDIRILAALDFLEDMVNRGIFPKNPEMMCQNMTTTPPTTKS